MDLRNNPPIRPAHIWLLCLLMLATVNQIKADTVELKEFPEMLSQYRSVTAKKADAEKTAKQFDLWQQQHPTEHLISLYRGALNCLIARDAWFPWNKMRYANLCMDQMDQSLAALEDQGSSADLLQAYIERGFVNSHLPDMFGRSDLAIEDFEAAQRLPQWSVLPEPDRQSILKRLNEVKAKLAKEEASS